MMCTGPACPEARVATSDLLAYMGPHAGVQVDEDCGPSVWMDDLVVLSAAPSVQPPPQCVVAPCCGGPCPPPGDAPHRYVFTLYALSVDRLGVPDDATAALAGFMINANCIGKASFTAKYGRPKS